MKKKILPLHTLRDWLTYLETFDPHKIDLGLERIRVVAEKFHLNRFTCPVITVAGTNGKGTTVAFLESMYRAANYRAGAYISPHLFQFNERIRLNGQSIDEFSLMKAFEYIETIRAEIALTYFEFTTLAALKIFQESGLDVVILEVGLGGRLDAVNIVDPSVAIITAIGIDHVDWLGPDRESIGREKAGIFRHKTPAVCGDANPPSILQAMADQIQTTLYTLNRDFFSQKNPTDWSWHSEEVTWAHLPFPQLPHENAVTALMAIQLLQKRLPVTSSAVQTGIQQANLPGRFQRVGRCIYDVAHNPHAAAWLKDRLEQEAIQGRILAVVGMLVDKDILGTLQILQNSVDCWYVGGLEQNARGAPAQVLCQNLAQLGVDRWYNCGSIWQAYQAALQACQTDDRVLILGSFYTVAGVLQKTSLEKGD